MEISVLMPVYNGECFLREAIDSILNQTFCDFELVIIDDGSTDSSLEIISSYNDKRIMLYKNNENIGLIKTLNLGLSYCNSRYIARMDQDDISYLNRLKVQYKFMEAHSDIGICGSKYINIIGGKIKLPKLSNYRSQSHKLLVINMLGNSAISHPTLIIRRSVLDTHHIKYNESFPHAEDYDFIDRLMQVTKSHVIGRPLLYYRKHSSQVSNVYSQQQQKGGDKIRLRSIMRLIPDITNDQFSVHLLLMKSALAEDNLSLLEGISTWSKLLIEVNEKNAVFDKNHFSKFIINQERRLRRRLL